MKIEPMKAADLTEVATLAEQLGYPVTKTELAERFRNIQHLAGYGLFVARSDAGKVIGWIQINVGTVTLLANQRAEIAALVVDENARGLGIGSALVQHVERWAQDNKIEMIQVRSQAKREEAHQFYLRLGYELLKTSKVFRKKI